MALSNSARIISRPTLKMKSAASARPPSTASIRMSDVAREAGVSVMTVSRALKPGSLVAAATRAKILTVVKRLGYMPDMLAGSLSSKRSGFVSLLVPSINNSHFAETVSAMKKALEPAGLQVLLGLTNYSCDEEERAIEWMLKRRPEAFVLTYDGHTARARALLRDCGIPVIEIWEIPSKPLMHVVGFSNRKAASDMTLALLHQGFKKIAYIGEAQDTGTRGGQRRRGFTDAMRGAGLSSERQIAFAKPPINISQGRAAFKALMTEFPDTEAVLCVSDPCAFGALTYCMEQNWAVPGKIALAGFGAFEISACSVPSITTLEVSGIEIGARTAGLILELVQASHLSKGKSYDPKSPQKILVHAKPILRASTGASEESR